MASCCCCFSKDSFKTPKFCFLWCIMFLLSVGCLVASFACAVRARSQFTAFSLAFSQFSASWDADLVFKIDSTNTAPVPDSSYYYTAWNGTWPGNAPGCYCSPAVTNSSGGAYKGVYIDVCTSNQTTSGCTNVPAGPKVTMSKWIGNQVVYALKKSGTGFLSTYKNMNEDGSCKSGFTLCGNPNSVSKGVCLPSGTSCPITDISSTGGAGFVAAGTFVGFSLYTSTANTQNPVSDLLIEEDHMCFVRSMYGITPNRTVYKLLYGDFGNCITEKNSWSVSQLGETTFLNQNGVDTSKLGGFDTTDTYLYKLLAARTIDWSPSCSSNVQAILDQPKQLDATRMQYLILFAIYIISLIFGCLAILISAWFYCSSNPKWKSFKTVFCVRVMCWIIVLPSLFICTIQVNQFVNSFMAISDNNCSNANTNSDFSNTGQKIRFAIGAFNIVMIIMSFLGMMFEAFTLWIALKSVNAAPAPGVNDVPQDPAAAGLIPPNNNMLDSRTMAKPQYDPNQNNQFMGQQPPPNYYAPNNVPPPYPNMNPYPSGNPYQQQPPVGNQYQQPMTTAPAGYR